MINLYDEISDFFDFGAVSSLEFKDTQAAKSYILKQIETANGVGKMNDLFAMSLFEYVKSIPITTPAPEVYALTEAETIRLTNVVGVPMPVNFDKWLAFLAAAEEASLSALGREKEATFTNVLRETAKQTAKDAADKANPKKNPVPFIIGGIALYLLIRR
jgi:hypothetical protein